MLGEAAAAKDVSCTSTLLCPRWAWQRSSISSEESWAEQPAWGAFPHGWSFLGPLWGCSSRWEQADPFSILISTLSIIFHLEATSLDLVEEFQAGSISAMRLLAPSPYAPHMPEGLAKADLCWQKCLFLFPWLSLTVPWSLLFGGAGEWRQAEEGQYRWDFNSLKEQIWMPLYGKSILCLTLECPDLKFFNMQDKISLMPMACGGFKNMQIITECDAMSTRSVKFFCL